MWRGLGFFLFTGFVSQHIHILEHSRVFYVAKPLLRLSKESLKLNLVLISSLGGRQLSELTALSRLKHLSVT